VNRRLALVIVPLAALASGCNSPSQAGSAKPLPAPMPVVEVTMTEYRFDYTPPAVSGRVLFRVTNRGQENHELSLEPLTEDFPPIDEQLHGSVRRFLPPFAGVATQRPGQRRAFAVDLQPGVRYALICFSQAPDGQSHALKGMSSEFRAGPLPG